jgi:hypothetical protein
MIRNWSEKDKIYSMYKKISASWIISAVLLRWKFFLFDISLDSESVYMVTSRWSFHFRSFSFAHAQLKFDFMKNNL